MKEQNIVSTLVNCIHQLEIVNSFKIKLMQEIKMFKSNIKSLVIGKIKKIFKNNNSNIRSRIITTRAIVRTSTSKEELPSIKMTSDKIILM